MVNLNDFKVLCALDELNNLSVSQRVIAQHTALSLGTVNATLARCRKKEYVDANCLTEKGRAALKPYQVDNAIIMAAGLSSRFAPISYEKPKGLLKVKGDVLIERQIKQLHEAGIKDITVVVGYKMEYFFYLADKYGVKCVANPDYATRNNNSTLWVVRNQLRNTYICSSDIYYTENPFSKYAWCAYYASQHVDGQTDEWCMETTSGNRIAKITIGGSDADIMLGHAYFDQAFSKHFVEILEREYQLPETAGKLWESIYFDHLKDFAMRVRRYDAGCIYEFDSLDQLRMFDPQFIENVDSAVLDNITSVLGCKKSDIRDFYPLKQGITNLSCHFSVGNAEYVYRHPGVGTDKMLDRQAELAALQMARDLGLDETFLYEDAQAGWKISRFVPHARNLDVHDESQLARAMHMCRRLHDSAGTLARSFDFYEEGKKYEQLLASHGPIDVPGYHDLAQKASRLKQYADADGFPHCVNHNDFFHLNFILDDDDRLFLIDWEYAGMADCANDFGTFVVCSELSDDQAERALEYYFDRPPTFEERRHFWAYVVLAGWCWYVWALARQAEGDHVDEWLFVYWRYADSYMNRVLGWYEDAQN